MRTLLIRNSSLAPEAALGDALGAAGVEYRVVAGAELADWPDSRLDDYTHMIALGGLESSRGPEPWIASQRRRMRAWLDSGRALLGVCLGAQILADAQGWVHLGIGERPPEQGFHPLSRTAAGRVAGFLEGAGAVFLAHDEGFVVEEEGALLAETARYHQAFRVGRALGIQFHPESTPESVEPWFARGNLPVEQRPAIFDRLRSVEHRRQAPALVELFYSL